MSDPVFMFCAPGLVFDGTEGIGSRFHVFRSWGLDLMFCDPGLIFEVTEDVWSRVHVLRSRTCFRRCRVRRVPFACFVRPDSFLAVSRSTDPIFRSYAPGLVFGGTKGVGSRFHVLRSRTRFRRYGGRRVTFPCFTRPDLFSAKTRVPGPIFMFCASGVV
jgi:hypothetical protein